MLQAVWIEAECEIVIIKYFLFAGADEFQYCFIFFCSGIEIELYHIFKFNINI